MLLQLRIRDFAIIDHVEVEFSQGFVVVTGETGAGKSILVDALLLALGGRARSDVVRTGAASAVVEALFDISEHPQVQARLEARDLIGDDGGLLLIRRDITAKGRGKVAINGNLSTVATLSEIAHSLVDISGQHDQQSLLHTDNHLEILDAFGDLDPQKALYSECYTRFRELEGEITRLRDGATSSVQRADFLRFQLEEIERIEPVPGEDEQLGAEQQRLGHAERLEAGVRIAEALLYSEDGSAFDRIGRAGAELEALARYDPRLERYVESLEGARREVQEASRVLTRYAEEIESDPARLNTIEERLAMLQRLMRKHNMPLDEVVVHRDRLRAELEGLGDLEGRIGELEHRRLDALRALETEAKRLTKARRKAAKRFAQAVTREVTEMDLDGAKLEVVCESREGFEENGFGVSGADHVEFLWAPNRGENAKPLQKIASGGELSRLMLAVKTVLSKRDLVSLYVFDEVDSGVGGRAADTIGAKIQRVAQDHQAIVITHLAPIAARAHHHWVVSKAIREGRTVSDLKPVTGKSRTEELARMIDGASASSATRRAAKEMLERARG